MTPFTHYTALGLAPTAPPEVIRAAYKALALIYHPDKTLHLSPQERVSCATVFRDLQSAFDVLSDVLLKAAYDAELARQDDESRQECSTGSFRASSVEPSTSRATQRKCSVKLTTPEEKAALRARTRQSVEFLRKQREKHDAEDSVLPDADLKNRLQVWYDLAEENKHDPPMHAHCAIRIYEYEQKVIQREREHEEWLANMSTAKPASSTLKTSSSKPAAHSSRTASPATTRSTSSPSKFRNTSRVEERKNAEATRVAAASSRVGERLLKKAQRDAAKKAHIDIKAAAVRAAEEKQQIKVAEQAQSDAERITIARKKAGARPLFNRDSSKPSSSVRKVSQDSDFRSHVGTSVFTTKTGVAGSAEPFETKNLCIQCGLEHLSFKDWRKCNAQYAIGSTHDKATAV